MSKIDIKNGSITVLIEIDGQVHLVGMSKERLEAVQTMVKMSAEAVIPTGKNQKQLVNFLYAEKNRRDLL